MPAADSTASVQIVGGIAVNITFTEVLVQLVQLTITASEQARTMHAKKSKQMIKSPRFV